MQSDLAGFAETVTEKFWANFIEGKVVRNFLCRSSLLYLQHSHFQNLEKIMLIIMKSIQTFASPIQIVSVIKDKKD